MDEDVNDLNNDKGYDIDDATGRNSARKSSNISQLANSIGALKNAENAAAKKGAKSTAGGLSNGAAAAGGGAAGAAKAAENIGRGAGGLFTGQGKQAAAGKGKFSGKNGIKKAMPLIAILLILVVAVGAISFIGQSFQLISLGEQVKGRENKLSATVYTRTENEVGRQLESTDPADSLSEYMIDLFSLYGFDYIENDNGDGTVARALIYNRGAQDATLISSAGVKNQVLNTLKATGSVINNYRDIASVPTGEDRIAAAWYGALSVVATGAWYDDSAKLTYERLGLNPSKFNTGNNNPSKEDILQAVKAGSASENVNSTTGTTTRYVWTKHEYKYCTKWTWVSKPEPGYWKCLNHANGVIWDWDSVSTVDNAVYEDPIKTTDPLPDKNQISAEWCYANHSYEPTCPKSSKDDIKAQSLSADPAAFAGEEAKTLITPEDDKDTATKALNNRAVLSAFSTNPLYPQGGGVVTTKFAATTSGSSVSANKSEESLISAILGMVKSKTRNFAHDIMVSIDKTKDGDGGNEMSYYGNLLNTPAKSYAADGTTLVSNIAATESSSFNSWFSDDIRVSADNKLVQKYDIVRTMGENGVSTTIINTELPTNYNNIDNTSATSRAAENTTNSPDKRTDIPAENYNYCQYDSDAGSTPCPYNNATLKVGDYYISEEVATYAYGLTSIDLNATPAGEEAAVAFNEGVSLLNDDMLKQSSGSYGDEKTLLDFYHMNQDYVAKLANYERYTKNPLDATSTNTFLGSIVSSLLPLATATRSNAILSSIAATTKVVSSSVSSLLPKAAAASLSDLMYINEETTTNCIANKTSDVLCDIYGNPIIAMDQEHMNSNMKTLERQMESWGYVKSGSCNSEKGCEVDEEYDKKYPDDQRSYTKWLLCTQNDSAVNNGLSTEQASKGDSAKTGFFRSLFNFFRDILFSTKKAENQVRNQVSCGGNYGKDSTAAERYKIYAQFTLDQRIKALTKYTEESAATAYLRKYYEANPLDQSYEAIIARESGLTVAEVQQAFADMAYAVYIARYDAGSRYHFIEAETSDLEAALSQTDTYDQMKTAAIVGKMQDFEELRNRSAICG